MSPQEQVGAGRGAPPAPRTGSEQGPGSQRNQGGAEAPPAPAEHGALGSGAPRPAPVTFCSPPSARARGGGRRGGGQAAPLGPGPECSGGGAELPPAPYPSLPARPDLAYIYIIYIK